MLPEGLNVPSVAAPDTNPTQRNSLV